MLPTKLFVQKVPEASNQKLGANGTTTDTAHTLPVKYPSINPVPVAINQGTSLMLPGYQVHGHLKLNEMTDQETEITKVILMSGSDSRIIKVDTASSIALDDASNNDTENLSSFSLYLGPYRKYSVKNYAKNDNCDGVFLRLKCTKCEFNTVSYLCLNKHIKTEHLSELFSCQQCLRLFLTKELLRKHRNQRHVFDKEWKCTDCKFTSHQYYNYKVHRRTHPKLILCSKSDCEQQFTTKRQAHNHMLKEHPDDIHALNISEHRCKICDSTFPDRCFLEKHLWTHFGVRPFSCKYCNFTSTQSASVSRHQLLKHFFPTKLRCSHCSKHFYNEGLYKDHLKRHLIYQCPLCSFKASSQKLMCKHGIDVHQETLKLYKCDKCSATFGRKFSLNKHQKYSTCNNMVISLQCSKCLKLFKNTVNLKRHTDSFKCNKKEQPHSKKPVMDLQSPKVFKCRACNEQFSKQKVLKKHLQYCVFGER